jgi:predicted phosphodiesterase
MKLSLMSDLHLEFAPMDLPGGDVLLLSGDILVADSLTAFHQRSEFANFFKQAVQKYNKVFLIAGNHEHYYGKIDTSHAIIQKFLQEEGLQVAFLDNTCVPLNDEYVLFGSTFWTDFNNNDFFACQAANSYMNDYRLIMNGDRSLIPHDTVLLNVEARAALQSALEFYKTKKFVVMTHHLPDMLSVNARFKPGIDVINYAYTNTGLKSLIEESEQIKFWFHGHTHDSCDYVLGNTRVVCNPRGYGRKGRNENPSFDVNLTIEI